MTMNELYSLIKTELITECSKKDLFFIDKAFLNAFFSDFTSSLKLGACIAINKKKYYTGYNQKCRQTICGSHYLSLHAEIHALANFMKQEYGKYSILYPTCEPNLTIYIVRLMNNPYHPPYGISKPCKRCESFLYQHNIKYIKYTDVENGQQVIRTMQRN
jgi:cytidine deaminase